MSSTLLVVSVVSSGLGLGCGGGGGETEADAGPPDADWCSNLAPLPVTPEPLLGFTGAEDFAFDGEGNYVAVDFNGDLVAISKTGMRRVLVPGAGGEAGTAFLPNGDLVINQASTGSILRINLSTGSVVPIISGLAYPNGLDVGLDGFIYVAENGSTRVRRVNPDTGEFTVIALGLVAPNGVAFGPDPNKLYIGSFGGGVAYEIDLSTPTLEGRSRVFGRTPGATTPEPVAICASLQEGDPCSEPFGGPGECRPFGGVLDCLPIDPCEGHVAGDPCTAAFVFDGVCTDIGAGQLICQERPQCLSAGDPCNAFGVPGECVMFEWGIQCTDIACQGQPDGGTCVDPYGMTATCFGEWPSAYCQYQDPCAFQFTGDPCVTDGGVAGTCGTVGFSNICMAVSGCDGMVEGDPCLDLAGIHGHCRGTAPVVCQADTTCSGLGVGDECIVDAVVHGACVDVSGNLTCEYRDPCWDSAPGSACYGLGFNSGTCTDTPSGPKCVTFLSPMFDACEGRALGGACTVTVDGHDFHATCLDAKAALYCDVKEDLLTPCIGLSQGDACEGASPTWGAYDGTCQFGAGGLECWQTGGGGGAGLDGINVDVCGNVYVTEFGPGTIWRFSPEGETVVAAQTGSGWIPNMHWGTGLGGFDKNVLYVADRDHSGLYGLHLGAPGPRQPFPPDPPPPAPGP